MEATEAAKLDLVAPDQRGRHGVEDRLHDDGGLALRHHEASGQLFDQDRLDHPKPPKEGASAVARRSVDSGSPTPTQCPRPGRRQCDACRAPGQPPCIAGLPSSLPRTSTSVRSAIFLWRFGTEDTPTRRARPPAQQSNTRKSPPTPTRSPMCGFLAL